jgi:anti-sigma B factor antagonist
MLNRAETPGPSSSEQSAATFGIVQSEPDQMTSVISVEGDLDLSTAPRLKWMLVDALETGHRRLVIDLSRATFMDSTALGVLVAIWRKLESGERLIVVCTRPDVLKIFEYAGMDGAFAIFSTLDDALAHARERAARAG